MTDVVLLDGSNLAHRAWHGAGGQPQYATELLRAAVARPVAFYRPSYAAVAVEHSGGSFRRTIDRNYKANRAEKDPVFAAWLADQLVGQEAIGTVPTVVAPGFEADDVIATLVDEAAAAELSVVVVTADKDAWALVDDIEPPDLMAEVIVLTPDGRMIGSNEVHEKLGVWPDEVRAYKALVGDPSDNVKGVSGIGPVRARWVIEQARARSRYAAAGGVEDYLDVLVTRPEWLKRAGGEAVARADARLAFELVGLRRDAPVSRRLLDCCLAPDMAEMEEIVV